MVKSNDADNQNKMIYNYPAGTRSIRDKFLIT